MARVEESIESPGGSGRPQRNSHGPALEFPDDWRFRELTFAGIAYCLGMLYTIAVVLLILWLLGMVSSYMIGGFIHILLVIAIVVILVRIISGRRPL